jgi:hypothetical protein
VESNWTGQHELDSSGSGWRQVAGRFEHGNEALGYIKRGEYLDSMRNYWLVKTDCDAWCWLRLPQTGAIWRTCTFLDTRDSGPRQQSSWTTDCYKREATRSSETSAMAYPATKRPMPEHRQPSSVVFRCYKVAPFT